MNNIKRVENFLYNDIVLYCKGWYHREGSTILQDLGYLFHKVYGWTPETEREVAHMMVRALDRFYEEANITLSTTNDYPRLNSFTAFHDFVCDRMSMEHLSYNMAVIRTVRLLFSRLGKDEIKLNPPVYGRKEYFKMQTDKPSMTYKEMNRIAKEYFKYED